MLSFPESVVLFFVNILVYLEMRRARKEGWGKCGMVQAGMRVYVRYYRDSSCAECDRAANEFYNKHFAVKEPN